MKISNFILCVVLLGFCNVSSAQLLEKTKKGYTLNGLEYKAETEILDLLSPRLLAYKSCQDAMRYKSYSKNFGKTSLVFIGVTGVIVSKLLLSENADPLSGYLSVGLFSIGAASLSGMMGIIFLMEFREKRAEVVSHYNAPLLGQNSERNNLELKLQVINNGLGLVLSF